MRAYNSKLDTFTMKKRSNKNELMMGGG